MERTRQDLEAALRRAKQLAKAEREWEGRREETRATLVARELALQTAQARLEEMLHRTVDAVLLVYDKERGTERMASAAASNTPQNPEDTTEVIMKNIVTPLLEGPPKTGMRGARRTTGATAQKPGRAKRSRPSKGKAPHTQGGGQQAG